MDLIFDYQDTTVVRLTGNQTFGGFKLNVVAITL